MVSAELSMAVLIADITLYGFMIAYYALSQILHEQEKSRLTMQLMPPAGRDLTREERDQAHRDASERWMFILGSAASGSVFLLGCSLFAIPSAILALLALGGFDILGIGAAALFLLFVITVAAGMVGVAVQGIRQNAEDFREKAGAPTRLMDILNRGIGKK